MPSLTSAVASHLVSSTADSAVYAGSIDPTWSVGSVPHGGYSLSIITNAAQYFMRLLYDQDRKQDALVSFPHPDPLHLSATYLVAVSVEDYQVQIRLLKRGRSISHLVAEFYQPNPSNQHSILRVTTQIIMTNFAVKAKLNQTLPSFQPGDRFYSSLSIAKPNDCIYRQLEKKVKFADKCSIYHDQRYLETHLQQDKLHSAVWCILNDEEEEQSHSNDTVTNLCPFFADMATNSVALLPKDQRPKGPLWFPTLHLAIEFKRSLPTTLTKTAILSFSKFLSNGQHELDSEIWSHPSDASLFDPSDSKTCHLLCISRQLALTLPLSINESRNTKSNL